LRFPFPLGLSVAFTADAADAALVAALSALVMTAGFKGEFLVFLISSFSFVKLELSSAAYFLLDSPTLRRFTAEGLTGVGPSSESSSAIPRFLLFALAFGGGLTISSESESSIIFLAPLEAGLRRIKPISSSSSLETYFISTSS